jgi:hypothetical protein
MQYIQSVFRLTIHQKNKVTICALLSKLLSANNFGSEKPHNLSNYRKR